LKYSQSHSHAGNLARIALSWAQFQAGIKQPILIGTHTPLPHLETCWLTALRAHLDSCKCRIEIDHSVVLPPQREHDIYIMDAIIESEQFTPDEVCKLNYCRLHLQAITISDITIAGGA
jgi:hypothetical protein